MGLIMFLSCMFYFYALRHLFGSRTTHSRTVLSVFQQTKKINGKHLLHVRLVQQPKITLQVGRDVLLVFNIAFVHMTTKTALYPHLSVTE